MAKWDEGSFMEGLIAGGLAGGTAGAVAAPATAGTSIVVFAIIGAIFGGLLKLSTRYTGVILLIIIFLLYGLGKITSFPPYLWIIIIIIIGSWIIRWKH